jgi:hypothetical protein
MKAQWRPDDGAKADAVSARDERRTSSTTTKQFFIVVVMFMMMFVTSLDHFWIM